MNAKTTRFLVLVLLGDLTCACAQKIDKITVPDPTALTEGQQCVVAQGTAITRAQALCIAKVSGLKPGLTRWQAREYADYVDVFNTTTKHPIQRGFSVRIRRIGGRVLSIEPWEEIIVQ